MHPSLQTAFLRLEQQKQAVASDLATWSPAHVRLRPAPNAWSALDVLDHLVKVETAALQAIRSEPPQGHRVTLRHRMGGLMVNCVMRSPTRIKVPAGAAMVLPGAPSDYAALGARWDAARSDWAAFLETVDPQQLTRGLFQHPVAGWMTVRQTVKFLSAHLRHHRYQLDRLRSAGPVS